MARGDFTVFNEAKALMIDGDWSSTDHFYIAICDNTTAPTAATATPALGDFTEVGDGGSYTSGGVDLGTLASLVTQSGGTMTFTSTVNPSWAQDAGNDNDAYWGIIYNHTQAGNDALGFVDLGGPVDMSAGDLTITWSQNGIFTIT